MESLLILSGLIGLCVCGTPTFADGGGASQFGVEWGLSVPDADNTSIFHVFGVKGESFISPQLSIGGYYFNSDKAGQINTSEEFNYSLIGVQAAYHIPGAQGDTFLGFRMGMTKLLDTTNSTNVTYSPYHYGVACGYDYHLSSFVSVGFEGSYLHVLPGRTFINGTEYDQPSFNIINFLISLQLRL